MTWSVPLADVQVTEADLEAIIATYRSGWLSMGPRTEAFEAEFAEFTGARHAFAVTNGTAALHLACLAVGLGPGDEVIVPSLTFVASVNAIAYTGATPVFADIAGLDAPWLDPASVAAARTERTKAVMHVPYGGHAGETAALAAWCEREGLILLEDTAHSVGSRLDGRHLGTFGAAGAFSFFSNKNLAVGEGGALTVADDAVAERIRLLRSHGMTTLTWDRHRGHAASYDVVELGFNYRIDEPRAALASSRLARIDAENAQRAELDARYRELLEPLGLICALGPRPGVGRAFHLFCVVLPAGRRPRGLPPGPGRPPGPELAALPAGPPLLDPPGQAPHRPAGHRGLRRPHGHAAAVRAHDHRPGRRGRRGLRRGARRGRSSGVEALGRSGPLTTKGRPEAALRRVGSRRAYEGRGASPPAKRRTARPVPRSRTPPARTTPTSRPVNGRPPEFEFEFCAACVPPELTSPLPPED